MNKVDFTLKNGRVERMHPKIAELLQRKGKGTYQTTAVQVSPQRAVLTPAAQPRMLTAGEDQVMRNAAKSSGVVVHPGKVAEEPAPVNDTPVDPGIPEDAAETPVDLASMSVDELREYAKRQGVQVHHRAGTEKIIEAIEKKAEE